MTGWLPSWPSLTFIALIGVVGYAYDLRTWWRAKRVR